VAIGFRGMGLQAIDFYAECWVKTIGLGIIGLAPTVLNYVVFNGDVI
jgi:hypothetical protein